jgi:hypothetical protein
MRRYSKAVKADVGADQSGDAAVRHHVIREARHSRGLPLQMEEDLAVAG